PLIEYDPEFGMGEDMFKDLALSKDNMSDYHSKLDDDHPGRKLNTMVLQRSAWPFSVNEKQVDLPFNMQEQISEFGKYYDVKYKGRALSWDHGLGTATLTARFWAGKKELSVSLYQAVVLLLFNQSEQLAFQDIKDQTRLVDDAELRRTLQSLACGKKKVLKKIPPGRDINDDDVFRFNADFTDPRAKIHINSIQAKVSPEESKKTNEAIEGDRKLYLDAAIVRIMKANKTMTYEKLKTATIDAVKNHFVPQVDVIKQRVDSLVEGDYLERDKVERNKFHYVA
ncbi:Cullin-4, partial [Leucoagaricus sp. SymC.cos]